MKYSQSISVFVPAYNEEENLEKTTLEILSFLKENFRDFEFIIVANQSKDKTSEIARSLSKKYSNVKIIQQKKFVGYGTQLNAGWENATKELVFYTDSDRQFDIRELKNFMNFIKEYDIVIGKRKNRKDPKLRIFYSKLYNLALRTLLGLRYDDIECAFKLCKRKVIDSIKPLTQDRGADAEFLIKSKLKGFKIKQLPVNHKPRVAGTSEAEKGGKLFVRIKLEIIKSLIKETIYLRRFKT